MKSCPHCNAEKPFSEFYKNKRMKSGYASWCIICYRSVYRLHDGKTDGRKLFQRYGITRVELANLRLAQEGRCKICKIELNPDAARGARNYPNIDHDHATGLVRGILCFKCNSGLGLFDEDPTRLRSAADYILAGGNI